MFTLKQMQMLKSSKFNYKRKITDVYFETKESAVNP